MGKKGIVDGRHNERRLETCTKAAGAPSVAMEREEQRNLSELSGKKFGLFIKDWLDFMGKLIFIFQYI